MAFTYCYKLLFKMKTEKQIQARIEGINEAISDNNEVIDNEKLTLQELNDIEMDIQQLRDRKKILEWVLK